MSAIQFWCWVLTAVCWLGVVLIHAWSAWREFQFRSRLREYTETGTWTKRWWR